MEDLNSEIISLDKLCVNMCNTCVYVPVSRGSGGGFDGKQSFGPFSRFDPIRRRDSVFAIND